jgi:2',3'-cyclic-nucleotide 2'-phosphodiesterase (5'-nucleotidase family)
VLDPLLQKYQEHLILDAGGWSERNERQRALSTRVFLEGMQADGLQAVNVAARDLLLGPQELQALQDSLQLQFLSANIYVDRKLRFQPYIVLQKEVAGKPLRIGIVGVTLPSQLALEEWPSGSQLEITDPLEAARQTLEGLRPQTDLRILLAHLPLSTLEEFARAEPYGYDLLISGTGEVRETVPVGPTPAVLSPGTRGKHLAWLHLRPGSAGKTEITGGQVLALDDRITDDPAMAARVAGFKTRLAAAGGDSTTVAHEPAESAASAPATP